MGSSIWLDFEFARVSEPKVNLVSCASYDKKNGIQDWWLHNDPKEQERLKQYLRLFPHVIGYQCVAEARCYLALGLNPLKFKWIDEFLEYRLLTNHNDELMYGHQLVDGRVKFFRKPPPKWERVEGETGFKPSHSLAEATYKLLGIDRDTKEKKKVRDLIISDPTSFTDEERKRILAYGREDVIYLPKIWDRIKEEYAKLDGETSQDSYFEEAFLRGRYSAHTAIMETTGYPINVEETKNFSKQIPSILAECQRDINRQFPEILPFRWNPRPSNFSWNQKTTREWVAKNHEVSNWMMTEGDKLSLSLEAFERFYSFKHDYPEGNFGAQMVRFLKLKQSLYGFSDTGGKRKNFWDSVGSDGRARPYMNIYGAQSGRSQPAASGFMFLKPAWMRTLVQPSKGRFIAGVDYGQQEFFLAGLESNSPKMIEAYLSGDPYLYGAKLAKVIPMDGTKEEYKQVRDVFKNTYLGIQFGMTKYGLSAKLTNDTGMPYTEEDAQDQIDLFDDTFPEYLDWKIDILTNYHNGYGIRLACGWRMWPDNPNDRSVCNVPIQGFGASIMRKAVDLAVEKGCKVIFTLHDAIYIEDDVGQEWKIGALMESMKEAFQYYFKGTSKFEVSGNIKLDPFAWSPNYKKDSDLSFIYKKKTIDVPCSNLYIDERSLSEFTKFSKYFSKPETDLL